jgi:hypothetical protein
MQEYTVYEVSFTNRHYPNVSVSAFVSPLRDDERISMARAELIGVVSEEFMQGASATVSIARTVRP